VKFPVILRLLLPLIGAVILHFYAGFSIGLPGLLLFLGITVLLASPLGSRFDKKAMLFNLIYPILFFLLGGYVSSINNSAENQNYFMNYGESWNNYVVKVLEPLQEKENSVKCVAEVIQVEGQKSCGKTLIYLQKDSSVLMPEYGDLIAINANFNEIKSNGNPKEFDYARYLKIHNIREQTYLKTSSWKIIGNDANPIFRSIYNLRNHLSNVIQNSGMSEKNAMVANALLLGQKEYLDKDVLRSYSSAGAMHVLAVSGLHVGIVMLILTFLVKPIKKFRQGKKLFVVIVLLGIWFYAMITGLSPSVMRAAVMFTFIVVGQEMQRDTTVYQSIMVSAFLLILIEPYIIFQVGFQLSYLAVLGIVYLQPKIENLFYVKNKILYKAWQISAVSIAAQIATFPLGLYYFHQFPNFFLLSNLLVIPLAFFILMLGIIYLVFHTIPFLNDLVFWLFDGLISLLNWGVEWVQKLPYSILWGISIEWYEVFILYVTILLGSVAFIYRKPKAFIAALVTCVFLLVFNIYENQKLDNENVVYVYNINDEFAIDVFYGQENIFFCSKDLYQDEDKLLFHVKHNWFYRTGDEQPKKWINIQEIDFLKTGDKIFGFLSNSNLSEYKTRVPKLDFLVLSEIDFIDEEILSILSENKTKIIVANKVDYSLKKYVTNPLRHLDVIDLNEEGAFEYFF
jgi:competence protein ComEC